MAAVGSHVWIEDPELAWIDGQVIEVAGTTVKVETTHGKIVQVELSKTRPKDTELVTWGEDDMTRLAYLHEPGVLHNLSLRYNINQIYTYTGNILIAINPFKKLPIYDETLMDSYRGAEFGELPPHVFAVADNTYRRLINDATSQSILVSGESGAGKTETTKMLMRYLAQMGGRKVTEGRTVEQQVLESNPVLEAFGNAKTVRNNNSSRFGKFVELQFDKQGRISGAAVRTYLLERSRVCQISDPERNYHCFYMLCAAPKEITEKYKLGHPKTFHYLNQTNCFELDNLDEAKEYIATRNAMSVVGISDEEQDAIFRIVAAILHLGNVNFAKGDDADSSKPKDEKAMFHLKMAAELFKCDAKGLEKSLCKRMIVTGGEKISKSLDPDSAVASRDALAKIVYSRMFDWLVNKINSSIGQDPTSEMLIGVLDIYGFESFKINSFEQFCINLTNEKLQQHFNQHVFKAEQEEYTKEEIKWSYIDFVDNQDILELIEKKPGGMIALLDQACILPRSNHEKFAQLLYDNFMKHERFSKPKFSQTDFTIKHYAGDVTYQTNLFLDKNKDYVIQEHQDLLSASGCAFTASLFATPAEQASSKSSKFSSIGAQFKLQLQSLVETLNKTEPHYIRCIKPNNVLKPGIFENSNVLQQLRCGGVMEAIRISCAGYPTKRAFNEFLNRFGLLCPEVFDENHDEKTASDEILKKVGFKDYQIGKTKVFLRAGQMAELDARRAEVLGKSAKVIQAKFRSHHARKGYLTLRNSAITLQSMWRGKLAVKLYTDMRREEAAKVIQKHRRRYNARKKYMGLQISSCIVQAGIRGMLARDVFRFRKETKYAVIIQAAWRRYSSLHYYENLKKVALIAQCAWRSKVARKDLRHLKMAARETGALQEAKNKLEKQVEELTYLLQWERTRMDGLEKNQSQEASKLKVALQETEEAKVQETAKLKVALKEMEKARTEETMKLQSALEEMEVQLKETYMQLEKEREIAQMAIDQQRADSEAALQQEREASKKAIEEVQEAARKAIEDAQPQLIIDTEKLEILEQENENLKCIVSSLEEKVSEAEKLYSESVRLSEERLQKAQDAEIEVEKLKNSLQSLEEKLSTVHSEEKLVKTNTFSTHRKSHSISIPSTTNENVLENGYRDIKEIKSIRPVFPSDDKSNNVVEIKQKPWKRNNEDVDVLIKCVQQDLGFSDGKPVAAWIIYKSFLHWKSFEDERTNVFDRVIEMLGSVTLNQNNDTLAYWLSNTSTLLSLLHRALKATGAAGVTPQQRRTSTLFGRVAQGFRSSTLTSSSYSNGGMVGGLDSMRQVEAKYPALLFKQQITVTVQKIYGIIRENVKAEIKAYLDLCIQAPRTAKVNMFRTPRSQPNASAQQANVNHWQKIIKCLSDLLESMQKNNVPTVLIKKIINETFSFINVQLFNSLLLRRDCCSFSNGEYVKAGLAELEQWCDDANEFAGSAWDELKHIRQAVGFLVIHQKSKKSLDEIVHELCPVLSMQQLYRISTMYQDDKYGTHSVAQDVLISMNALMAEDSNKDEGKDENSSFLLNDNCSAPLCGEEISKHIQETDFSNISCPSELYNNHSFQFLQPTAV